jgi:cell division protein FtsL
MAEPARNDAAPQARGVRWPLVSALLLSLCVATAFGVVYAAHGAREQFRELEKLRREENEIQIEWRQLLLERSTQSSHARVEDIATSELKMVPVSGEIRTVVPE